MNEIWIILGASSAMARAFARRKAESGAALILAGRDQDDLAKSTADLTVRGAADVTPMRFDTRDAATFGPIIDAAKAHGGQIGIAVFAGSMPPQEEVEADAALMDGVVTDNFAGLARFLLEAAPVLEDRGAGQIVAVSSVAGDRGRLKNYAYGAAKAGFQTFAAGLRNRLGRKGVHVLTVKPGFVDTAMTWGLDGMFLVASPDDVARDIEKGLRKKRNVIYTPWFWIGIMGIIRSIPERIFKKLQV